MSAPDGGAPADSVDVDASASHGRISLFRRIIVFTIVIAFGIAAIGGIVVLLGAQLGETAGRVLLTTAVVGLCSIALLCCAALLGRPLQLVGVIGVGVTIVAAALSIWMVWTSWWLSSGWDAVFRLTWTAEAASVAFALASLLLLLVQRRRAVVRVTLFATIGLIALLLVLTIILIWWSRYLDSEVFSRLYGIVAILTALGAVVVPVLSLLVRDEPNARDTLTPAGAAMLADEARRRGLSPDELVRALLAGSTGPDATPGP